MLNLGRRIEITTRGLAVVIATREREREREGGREEGKGRSLPDEHHEPPVNSRSFPSCGCNCGRLTADGTAAGGRSRDRTGRRRRLRGGSAFVVVPQLRRPPQYRIFCRCRRRPTHDIAADTAARRAEWDGAHAVQLQPGQRDIVLGEVVQGRPRVLSLRAQRHATGRNVLGARREREREYEGSCEDRECPETGETRPSSPRDALSEGDRLSNGGECYLDSTNRSLELLVRAMERAGLKTVRSLIDSACSRSSPRHPNLDKRTSGPARWSRMDRGSGIASSLLLSRSHSLAAFYVTGSDVMRFACLPPGAEESFTLRILIESGSFGDRASRRLRRHARSGTAACNREFAFSRAIAARAWSSWTTWTWRARAGIAARCRPKPPSSRRSPIMRTCLWSVSIVMESKGANV